MFRSFLLLAPACAIALPLVPLASDDDLLDVASAPRRRETPIEQIAGSVTIITRDQIERRGWRTLTDALNEVPGLQVVQAGGLGSQTSLFMRGTESNHTLVLLDGIEISDPSNPGGVFEPALLSIGAVERIEISRGPQSTLYGSDAIGGVVNIISRKGRGGPKLYAWGEVGGFGSANGAVGVQGSTDIADYAVEYSRYHSRGISAFRGGSERDGFDTTSLSSRLGIQLSDALRVNVMNRVVSTDLELDPFRDDPNTRGETEQFFLRTEAALELLDGSWEQRLGVSLTDHDRKDSESVDALSGASGRSTFKGSRLKFDWQHDFHLAEDNIFTLGAVTERERIDTRVSTLDGFGGGNQARAHENERTTGVYVQDQFAFGDRVFGTLGARLDHHGEFGSHPSYQATLAYVAPGTGTKLHASVGTAYKAPTLDDLYGVSVFAGPFPFISTGNPDLDPEKSRGYELGVQQPLFDGNLRLGVVYFQNDIRDLLQFVLDPSFTSSTLENVERARTRGLESQLNFSLGPRLRFSAHHTYTQSGNRDTDRDLLRRPGHMGAATLEFRPVRQATVSTSFVYTGSRMDIDAVSFQERKFERYNLTHLSGTYTFANGWKVFGRLENLFDVEYSDPDGFGMRGFAGYAGLYIELK